MRGSPGRGAAATPSPVGKEKTYATDKKTDEGTPKHSDVSKLQSEVWAAQCDWCNKWRVIPTQEEYEEIRRRLIDDPFTCKKLPDISCSDPSDLEYNSERTWVADKPNIPKTPPGFKRLLIMRKDYSKMDCYYVTPAGKRLRTMTEVTAFLEKHSEYKVSNEDFSFTTPRIMIDTLPGDVATKKVHTHPGDVPTEKVHTHPGDVDTKKVRTHPGDVATNIVHTHPGNVATKKVHTHPGDVATKKVHTHPGDVATKKVHTHPGDVAATKKVHTHPGDVAATKKVHTHPGDVAATKKVQTHPGYVAATKKVHAHPGDVAATNKIHTHPRDVSTKNLHTLPGDVATKKDSGPRLIVKLKNPS